MNGDAFGVDNAEIVACKERVQGGERESRDARGRIGDLGVIDGVLKEGASITATPSGLNYFADAGHHAVQVRNMSKHVVAMNHVSIVTSGTPVRRPHRRRRNGSASNAISFAANLRDVACGLIPNTGMPCAR